LQDADYRVRSSAAWTIACIGPQAKSAVTALVRALTDQHPYVRSYAAAALGKIGPQAKDAVPDLLKAIEDVGGVGPTEVGVFAIRALGDIGPPARAAIPLLRQAANGNEEERTKREVLRRQKGLVTPPHITEDRIRTGAYLRRGSSKLRYAAQVEEDRIEEARIAIQKIEVGSR
jgi:hypothetical protein